MVHIFQNRAGPQVGVRDIYDRAVLFRLINYFIYEQSGTRKLVCETGEGRPSTRSGGSLSGACRGSLNWRHVGVADVVRAAIADEEQREVVGLTGAAREIFDSLKDFAL